MTDITPFISDTGGLTLLNPVHDGRPLMIVSDSDMMFRVVDRFRHPASPAGESRIIMGNSVGLGVCPTGAGAALQFGEDGLINRTSSAKRYKDYEDIEDNGDEVLAGIRELTPIKYVYKEEMKRYEASKEDPSVPVRSKPEPKQGFLAEDVEEHLGFVPGLMLHSKDADGEPQVEVWSDFVLVPALMMAIRALERRVEALEASQQ